MIPEINPEIVIKKLKAIPMNKWKYIERVEDKGDHSWNYEDGYRRYTSLRGPTKVMVLNNFISNGPLGFNCKQEESGTYMISIPSRRIRITGGYAHEFFDYLEAERLKSEEAKKDKKEKREQARIKRLEDSL